MRAPATTTEIINCLDYGAGQFRTLGAWLHHMHVYAANGHQPFADLLPAVKDLLTGLDAFGEAATVIACELSGQKPEDDSASCGLVFSIGAGNVDPEIADWRRRVNRRNP